VGASLIGYTFWQAFQLFSTPPETAMGGSAEDPLNVNETVQSLVQIVWKILILLVMAAVGSLLANTGIKLYGQGHHSRTEPNRDKKKKKEKAPTEG
jgi:hypothetical protein